MLLVEEANLAGICGPVANFPVEMSGYVSVFAT